MDFLGLDLVASKIFIVFELLVNLVHVCCLFEFSSPAPHETILPSQFLQDPIFFGAC